MESPAKTFIAKFAESLGDRTFVRLTLSRPAPESGSERIVGRLVDIKNRPNLSITARDGKRDITKNLALEECTLWLAGQLEKNYQSALLNTTARDWQFSKSKEGKERLIRHKPAISHVPARQHDRAKERFLDAKAQDWLHALGLTDEFGKVRISMADKFRQINHYLEIISHLAEQSGWMEQELEREIVLADMGCGKAYLTFATWHLFNRVWNKPARVLGVEARADLVNKTAEIASKFHAPNLEFVCGTIASTALPRVDGLIALHACDTATDEAILRGIQLKAKLILVAPCCQKQLRPQFGKPAPLAPILRHGLMEERMAEWVTDGLRALYLEWAGYETKIFEFISTEHTPKNLMISAIQKAEPFRNPGSREKILVLKQYFGIQQHALDPLLVTQGANEF